MDLLFVLTQSSLIELPESTNLGSNVIKENNKIKHEIDYICVIISLIVTYMSEVSSMVIIVNKTCNCKLETFKQHIQIMIQTGFYISFVVI